MIPEFDRAAFTQELTHAALTFNLKLSQQQSDLLLDYLQLFIKWNQTYNLSAIREPREMLRKHLIDSLSLVALMQDEYGAEKTQADQPWRFIDVGTGGGLPGVPLAICLPHAHITLLDSAGKKMRFLFQVKQALKLDNVAIENVRVENFKPEHRFDAVTSRAFASLALMTSRCRHLLVDLGKYWAMKGVFPQDELSAIEKHYNVVAHHSVEVPGLDAERCVLVLTSV